jgi:hypothetical protein
MAERDRHAPSEHPLRHLVEQRTVFVLDPLRGEIAARADRELIVRQGDRLRLIEPDAKRRFGTQGTSPLQDPGPGLGRRQLPRVPGFGRAGARPRAGKLENHCGQVNGLVTDRKPSPLTGLGNRDYTT